MIDTEDLIQPVGPLVQAMFPDDTADAFDDRLQAYLDDAYEKLAAVTDAESQDIGAKAYALARGFEDAATIFTTKPSSASLQGLGSVGFSANAIAEWARKAREQWAIYEEVQPIELGVVDEIPQSTVLRTRVCW